MSESTGAQPRDRARLYVLLVCVGYALVRSIMAVSLSPSVYSDTVRYWQPGDPFSVFSVWTGSMAPSLLPQLLFLLPIRMAMLVQGAIAGLVWGFAAATLMITSRLRLLGWLAGVLVLLLGLLPYNAAFENSVLSESLANSFSLLCLLCAFLLCAPTTRDHLGVTVELCLATGAVALAAAALSRPSTGLILLPCLGVGAFFQSRTRRIKSSAVLVSVVLVLGVVAWGASATLHETHRAGWFTAANRLGARMSPGYLEQANAAGLPDCDGLGQKLLAMPEPSDRVELVHSASCPELRLWLEEGGLSVITEVRTLPAETLAAWRKDHFLQWQPVVYQEMHYPMLDWPRFAGRELYLLNRTYHAVYVRAFVLSGFTAVLLLILSLWIPRLKVGSVRSLCGLFVVFAWTVIGYSFVTWVLDTEQTRHFLPVQAVTPVICVIFLIYAGREILASPT